MAARADMFEIVDSHGVPTAGGPQVQVKDDANAVGHRAVAVPGVVAALYEAHRRFGRLAWAAGSSRRASRWPRMASRSRPRWRPGWTHRAKLARFPATARCSCRRPAAARPERSAPAATWPGAIAGSPRRGPVALYRGALARAIGDEMARGGGILSRRTTWTASVHGSGTGRSGAPTATTRS